MGTFLQPAFLISILLALSVHEAAHAWAALKLGDATAKMEGRLTLNPLAHLDPLGTILFVIVGFGWGKPVPVNPYYFKKPKRDAALVSLAGPASNLLLALIAFILFVIVTHRMPTDAFALLEMPTSGSFGSVFVTQLLMSSLFLNLGLMAFNLLPVAPLDGSKILQAFIPLRYEDRYDEYLRYGPYVLLAILVLERVMNFTILSGWIGWIMDAALSFFEFFGHLIGL